MVNEGKLKVDAKGFLISDNVSDTVVIATSPGLFSVHPKLYSTKYIQESDSCN